MIVWDESKRRTNIAKHGYDFAGCDAIFDHQVVTWEDARNNYDDDMRINVLGWLHDQLMHLTYTDDGETMRAISLREATTHETKHYFQEIAR